MADPRFFENLGPFTLAQICEKAGIAVPAGADGAREVFDLADLAGSRQPAPDFLLRQSRLARCVCGQPRRRLPGGGKRQAP